MGRRRLEEGEKKVDLTLKVKKKYVDELKEHQINISALFDSFIEQYLVLKHENIDINYTFEEFTKYYRNK
jgi:hypothetical protein